MGKYVLLITLGVSAALAAYAGQFKSAQVEAGEEITDRQKLVLARQIARSAYASGASELKRNFSASLNQCKRLDGGTFELTTSPLPGDTVQVRAVGRHGADGCSCTDCPQYAISGEATLDPNGSFSALTFDGPLESANLSGGGRGPVISGNDASEEQDRNGVSLSRAADEQKMKEEFCKRFDSDVQGIGGGCDVVHDPDIDLSALNQEVSDLAENQSTHSESALCGGGKRRGKGGPKGSGPEGSVGSSGRSAVVTIEGNCKLSGKSGGTGILYVDGGSLTMTGNSEWKGLVVVSGEGSFKASKGTPRVLGNVSFYDGGALDMRGTASVQYSSGQLAQLQEEYELSALEELKNSSAQEEVRMTNRSQEAMGGGPGSGR